jgi:hypothetical protein
MIGSMNKDFSGKEVVVCEEFINNVLLWKRE